MGRADPKTSEMASEAFLALREELLAATALMSCAQTLDLADLLHGVIRSRKSNDLPRRSEGKSFRGEEVFGDNGAGSGQVWAKFF